MQSRYTYYTGEINFNRTMTVQFQRVSKSDDICWLYWEADIMVIQAIKKK